MKEGNEDKPKNKGGRPRAEIDWKTLQGCCEVGCTKEECAGILGVSAKTLERRLIDAGWEGFDVYFKSHFDKTKQSLRRMQIRSASNGNVTMQIWLGKQFLGQRDKADLDVESGIEITWDKDLERL